MRISFENFGKAGKGEVLVNDLTIICGPNGSGKTYASYAIYGCLNHFSEFLDFGVDEDKVRALSSGQPVQIDLLELIERRVEIVSNAGREFDRGLDSFFNAAEGFFSEARFGFELDENEFFIPKEYTKTLDINKSIKIDAELVEGGNILKFVLTGDVKDKFPRQVLRRIVNDVISDCLVGNSIPDPFVVTSERTGVALFYKELDINRNAIISHISSSERLDPIKVLQAMRSRYARPIQHNIEIVRDYGNVAKLKSFLKSDKKGYAAVFDALSDLVGGVYKDSDNQLTYTPKVGRNKAKVSVPLYIASSSVKSLFLVDLYVNHLAKRNGILIIDEPELNLHPDNQVKIARLVARLVNAGVKVLVTTHSDYFLREINNLITLGGMRDSAQSVMKRYGYRVEDLLDLNRVSAYCSIPDVGFCEMGKSSSGLDTKIFDGIISSENFKAQDIFSSIE